MRAGAVLALEQAWFPGPSRPAGPGSAGASGVRFGWEPMAGEPAGERIGWEPETPGATLPGAAVALTEFPRPGRNASGPRGENPS